MTGRRVNAADWTPDMIETVTRRWNAGEPAADIARDLGLTRGQVCGKTDRLGLARRRAIAVGDARGQDQPRDTEIERAARADQLCRDLMVFGPNLGRWEASDHAPE